MGETAPNPKLLERAYRILAKRAQFEEELRGSLLRYGDEDAVDAVVAYLSRRGILDDTEAARTYIAQHVGKRAIGPLKIEADLAHRGAPEAQIAEILPNSEEQLALALTALDAKRWNADGGIAERARAGRFLAGRGFDEDTVETVLEQRFPIDF